MVVVVLSKNSSNSSMCGERLSVLDVSMLASKQLKCSAHAHNFLCSGSASVI
jgi:hypothetical protein